jgi:hypothetical protein
MRLRIDRHEVSPGKKQKIEIGKVESRVKKGEREKL